jgi:hypothetical protein
MLSDKALHHFGADSAFVWNVSVVWQFAEVSEIVFAACGLSLADVEHCFNLNQPGMSWVFCCYFDS